MTMGVGTRVTWKTAHPDDQQTGTVIDAYESTPLHPFGGSVIVRWDGFEDISDDGALSDEIDPYDLEEIE
jgi:hypothetical protein